MNNKKENLIDWIYNQYLSDNAESKINLNLEQYIEVKMLSTLQNIEIDLENCAKQLSLIENLLANKLN